MAYARWITLLSSITCALYGVSPEEVNMDSFTTRAGSMGQKDTTERLANAKDKGFKPMLFHFAQMMNEYIMPIVDKDFIFGFEGIDPRDEDRVNDWEKTVLTVNEARTRLGFGPHENEEMGKAPISQPHLQFYQQVQAQQQGGNGQGIEAGGPQVGDEGGQDTGSEEEMEGGNVSRETSANGQENGEKEQDMARKSINPFDPGSLIELIRC
jgi:hypothetical protein